MNSKLAFSALFCISLAAPLTAHAAASKQNTGFYHADSYIAAANPAAFCGTLGLAVGPSPAGSFYYPGPSATGAILRYSSAKADSIVSETFTKTPAAGAASWAGTVTQSGFPIAFRARLAYVDAQSFTGVFTLKVVVGGKTCTLTENISLYQTGD